MSLDYFMTEFTFHMTHSTFKCRLGCGACCIAPSISSPIPGMPNGKAAGERCIQLNKENLCLLFGKPERPSVCLQFSPESAICGERNEDALRILTELETVTLDQHHSSISQ